MMDHQTVPPDTTYQIFAASDLADDRTRVLKHNDTFAVFDHFGDIKPGGLGEEGLYHEGTRYLSALLMDLDGRRPFVLGSTIRDENDQLAVALTNPAAFRDGTVHMPQGTLHLRLRTFLWRGTCYRQLRIKNHGPTPMSAVLGLHYRADFADIFEVRGMKRKARGQTLPPTVSSGRVVLGYRGLDGEERRTILRFNPAPAQLSPAAARHELTLAPNEEIVLDLAIICR